MNHDLSLEARRDWLERSVRSLRGRRHTRRCALVTNERVARDTDEREDQVSVELRPRLDLPDTKVAVALAFLGERGCVDVRRRRPCPGSQVSFEDAMLEYHALELGAEGSR